MVHIHIDTVPEFDPLSMVLKIKKGFGEEYKHTIKTILSVYMEMAETALMPEHLQKSKLPKEGPINEADKAKLIEEERQKAEKRKELWSKINDNTDTLSDTLPF